MSSILINLAGAPSVGKSTTAAKLFAALKDLGLNAEYVQEFVKGICWEKREIRPYDQWYFFGEQSHAESRLFNQVSYIITDSPSYLTAFYHWYTNNDNSLRPVCKHYYEMAKEIDNVKIINFFLTRKKGFQVEGRIHTEAQSDEIAVLMKEFLIEENYPFIELDCPDEDRIDIMLKEIDKVTGGVISDKLSRVCV